MAVSLDARIAPNWSTAAGAVEGILSFLGVPLPRYAVTAITGHAWHFCLATREGVTALPSGPLELDWDTLPHSYARTGVTWERFSRTLTGGPGDDAARDEAVAWATGHLDAGRPLTGFDFHLHEFAVVYGYDPDRAGFLVDDVLTPEVGPLAPWRDWPSAATRRIELLAPVAIAEPDAAETIVGTLEAALVAFAGEAPPDGQPRGTGGLLAWADAFDSDAEVDRAGNAYTLAVLQSARLDGASFLAALADSLPGASDPLLAAAQALREMGAILSPLTTLFPFPTGGHGNVRSPGLRQAAAAALRRAADAELRAAEAIRASLQLIREDQDQET